MKPLPASEIRERFLAFFEERGHKRLPSDSLIPANDPTLLFTGAGMNQFKDMFLGKGKLPYKRVATSQKCLRVPDLENVGETPRHHTFFEMLGHFSFGDYFKKECIQWEWAFFHEALGIPEEQMVVTIYTDDDEAYGIWRDVVGLPPEKIFRFGEKENFWPAEAPSKGPNGPCGPCSEIYFDDRPGEPMPPHEGLKELPDKRFTEIGNCVFTQFERQEGGTLAPLPQKNIDVGLGLERIAAVLAGARNNFETDLFRPYLDYVAERSGRKYGADPRADVRMRRIADHARAVVFCIADGALPGNEGRGYVVRKILRRASRDGMELGIDEPFLVDMVELVGEVMGDAYPEVRENAAQCRALIRGEEEGFATVYRQGMARLEEYLARLKVPSSRGGQHLVEGSGEFAFQLHDTYGFPVDITRQVMAERGFALDEKGFQESMEEQRARARGSAATGGAVFAGSLSHVLRDAGFGNTEFVGYGTCTATGTIQALVGEGDAVVDRLDEGAEGAVVADRTPFYAEAGGQVGDRGEVRTDTGRAHVHTTRGVDGYHLHAIRVEEGHLETGQAARLEVDEAARRATERNHTATHLLHAALKNVLGKHVSQAGSLVAPDRLRFDFTHPERLTEDQIAAIEDEVNREIRKATPVEAVVRPMTEAKKMGYIAMFGEKYGDDVRTLTVGDYSRELCGGTHVANAGNIGSFRIVSEAAISAGTRRIEAVTGEGLDRLLRKERRTLASLAGSLKVAPDRLEGRVLELLEENKRLRKELQKATAADVGAELEAMKRGLRESDGVRIGVHQTRGLTMKEVQDLLQRAQKSLAPMVGVVLSAGDDGVLVGATVSKSITDRVRAGDLVKRLTGILGGGGGGRPETAQGKGKDPARIPDAVAALDGALQEAGLGP